LPPVIFAVEQSTQNLSGAFFLILVMIAVSFLAGFGLCFILMHWRKDRARPTPSSGSPVEPPSGYGSAADR
jgi:hypothetical protein